MIEYLSQKYFLKWMKKEVLKGAQKILQYDLSKNTIFRGFKCLLSPWNMLRNIENQQRSSEF